MESITVRQNSFITIIVVVVVATIFIITVQRQIFPTLCRDSKGIYLLTAPISLANHARKRYTVTYVSRKHYKSEDFFAVHRHFTASAKPRHSIDRPICQSIY